MIQRSSCLLLSLRTMYPCLQRDLELLVEQIALVSS